MSDRRVHEKIYLHGEGDDVLWCEDSVDADDVEYVRSDIVATLEQSITDLKAERDKALARVKAEKVETARWKLKWDRYRKALEEMHKAIDSYNLDYEHSVEDVNFGNIKELWRTLQSLSDIATTALAPSNSSDTVGECDDCGGHPDGILWCDDPDELRSPCPDCKDGE